MFITNQKQQKQKKQKKQKKQEKQQYAQLGFLVLLGALATGCASMDQTRPMKMEYRPNSYIPSNPLAQSSSVSTIGATTAPLLQKNTVLTSAGFTNSPQIKMAYEKYMVTGNAEAIKGEGFITLPFNPYSRPIIQCAPLQTCQIVLEKGEKINAIALGDTTRWMSSKIYTGTPEDGSWIVILKPTALSISTNLTIATDKRVYNLGLLSKNGVSPVVNFWYPSEMADHEISNSWIQKVQANDTSKNIVASGNPQATNQSYVDIDHLNFNYALSGDNPAWTPTQVFDDGNKTWIRMPPATDRMALPVLYVYQNGQETLQNYQYTRPYIRFDGLFEKARLIDGSGNHKTEVDIINNNFA
ncbi:TrbG/VirB9 family P-type conjugative transfer protein [Cysteiniphilum sp. 6C5]|uniref:TrbG/VirB9 family P-type conjugative transfer protein n=1 Tax=unclassified Cysteiniphilum TaxID=2610889 RepID=UPI003F831C1C